MTYKKEKFLETVLSNNKNIASYWSQMGEVESNQINQKTIAFNGRNIFIVY